MKTITRFIIAAMVLIPALGVVEFSGRALQLGSLELVSKANARVGRPLTPLSVAGVARRTTRRAIRRGAYVGAIPAGCKYGTYNGYSLYRCGGVYYQKSGGGYVVVYF